MDTIKFRNLLCMRNYYVYIVEQGNLAQGETRNEFAEKRNCNIKLTSDPCQENHNESLRNVDVVTATVGPLVECNINIFSF